MRSRCCFGIKVRRNSHPRAAQIHRHRFGNSGKQSLDPLPAALRLADSDGVALHIGERCCFVQFRVQQFRQLRFRSRSRDHCMRTERQSGLHFALNVSRADQEQLGFCTLRVLQDFFGQRLVVAGEMISIGQHRVVSSA